MDPGEKKGKRDLAVIEVKKDLAVTEVRKDLAVTEVKKDLAVTEVKKEILAKDIGRFTKKGQACRDRGKDLQPADRDPFWVAFSRAFSGEIS